MVCLEVNKQVGVLRKLVTTKIASEESFIVVVSVAVEAIAVSHAPATENLSEMSRKECQGLSNSLTK